MARAPQERRYESQVDAGGAARLTGVSPEAFGAGIGRSAAQLGGVLHRANVEAKELEAQRQYESDFAAGTKAVAEFKLEARKKALDMETNPAPAGAGHAEGYRKWYGDRSREVLSAIANPRVRERMDVDLAGDAGSMNLRAEAFQAGRRVAAQWQDIDDGVRFTGAVIRTPGTTRDQAFAHINSQYAAIDAASGTDEDKRKAKATVGSLLASEYIDSLPPEQQLAELDSGAYAGTLDDKVIGPLRDRAEAAILRAENAKKSAASTALTAQRDAWSETVKLVEKGVHVELATIDRQIAEAEQAADKSRVVDLQIARQAALVLETIPPNATPMQVRAQIEKLEATEEWKKRDRGAVFTRDALVGRLNEVEKAVPYFVPPDLRTATQQEVALYEGNIIAWSKTHGKFPRFVYGEHLKLLQDMMASGEGGQQQVLAYISKFSPEAAYSSAVDIAPGDPVFQIAATLEGHSQQLALAGRKVAKEKTPADDIPLEEEMHEQLAGIRQAFRGASAVQGSAIEQTAVSIARALIRQSGAGQYTDAIGNEAARLALGGEYSQKRQGGLHVVNEGTIALPGSMTAEDFDRRYWQPLDGLSEAYVGGRYISWNELRRNFQLVNVKGEGKYEWRDADGNAVLGKNGWPLKFEIWKAKPYFPPLPQDAVNRGMRDLKRSGFQ